MAQPSMTAGQLIAALTIAEGEVDTDTPVFIDAAMEYLVVTDVITETRLDGRKIIAITTEREE